MRQQGNEATRQQGAEGDGGNCQLPISNCRLVALATAADPNALVVIADAVSCREDSGAPLKRVRLSPANTVKSKNGTFIVDAESWKAIEAEFNSHGAALEIDLEHESMRDDLAPKDRLGAVGWIEKLSFDESGLYADVRWNEEGRTRIQSDRFRYISPTVAIRKSDNRVIRIKSAGLVNEPAIPHQERLAAKEGFDGNKLPAGQRKDTPMNELLLIGKDLGLAEADCTVEKINNKIGEVKKTAKSAEAAAGTVTAVCKALGVAETASETEIVARVTAMKSDQSAIATQATELKALRDKMADRDAEELLKVHGKGKLNPNAKEEWAVFRKLAVESPDTFIKVMAERPVLIEGGRTTPPEGTAKPAGATKEEELIANSIKEHKGDYAAGIEALQLELKQPYLDRGLTHKAANEACREAYPKIFAV